MEENTRLNVSSEGMPFGNSKNERKKSSFALAYVSISFQVSEKYRILPVQINANFRLNTTIVPDPFYG